MTDGVKTVRDLIGELLDYPMEAVVYVSKGVGPVGKVEGVVRADATFVVLEPVRAGAS